MKIKWRDMFGTTEYESTVYEPTYVTWPHPAPDPRELREERDRYRRALESIVAFAWEEGKDPRRVVNALKRRARKALDDEQ